MEIIALQIPEIKRFRELPENTNIRKMTDKAACLYFPTLGRAEWCPVSFLRRSKNTNRLWLTEWKFTSIFGDDSQNYYTYKPI